MDAREKTAMTLGMLILENAELGHRLAAAHAELATLKEAAAKDSAEKIAADKAAGLVDETEAGLRTAALRSVA